MLPRELEIERSSERTKFDLPTRDIGLLRFFGLLPILFSVGFAWMPAREMIRMAAKNIAGNGSAFEWIFVGFLSIFVIVAVMPFGIGLFILAGRTRVVVTKDRLIMTELAGPIRWSRKTSFDEVERLEIGGAKTVDGQMPEFISALCGITVVLKNGKKTPVAVGYRRELLQPLASEISSLMQRRGKSVTIAEATLKPETDGPEIETEQRAEKPAGSKIELTTSGWNVEFKVPALGLVKGSCGLMPFSIFWLLIVSAISATIFLGKASTSDLLTGMGFLSIFWAVGIGMLLTGIHLGSRRWTLRADPARLEVMLKSAFRSRTWRWTAGEITTFAQVTVARKLTGGLWSNYRYSLAQVAGRRGF